MSSQNALLKPTAACMAASRWIRDHLPELVRAHPNQWVAVADGRVVGASPDLGNAATDAERVATADAIAYHFIDDGTLIFTALR